MLGLLVLAGCTGSANGSAVVEVPAAAQSTFSGDVKELTVDTYSWGITSPSEQIKKGDKVRLRVTSSSGVHGVAIPELGVASGVVAPGQDDVIEFVAEKSGTFQMICNVPCGRGHMSMRGQLVVE